jgi:hypothetical protein
MAPRKGQIEIRNFGGKKREDRNNYGIQKNELSTEAGRGEQRK